MELKLTKLEAFIATDGFDNLPSVQQDLLTQQRDAMAEYADILSTRLSIDPELVE